MLQNILRRIIFIIIFISSICIVSSSTESTHYGFKSTNRVAIIYNTKSAQHSHQLLQSVFISLTDSEVIGDLEPQFIDLAQIEPSNEIYSISVKWLIGNQTQSVVSLLNEEYLIEFAKVSSCQTIEFVKNLKVFTPLSIQNRRNLPVDFKVYSLQMNELALAYALLHRMSNVGCNAILPVMDDDPDHHLSLEYFKIASKIPILDPIVILNAFNPTPKKLKKTLISNQGNGSLGVLLLSSKNETEMARRVWEQSENLQSFLWFSTMFLPHSKDPEMFGLYSVQYVGAGQWDNPERRRLLRRLNQFTGPSPLILSTVLAYDAVHLAKLYGNDILNIENVYQGMSGDIQFDEFGDRTNGVYFGISTIPNLTISNSSGFLQPSSWILEDLVNVVHGEEEYQFHIIDHQIATSSIYTKQDLLNVQVTQKIGSCFNETMEVITHDPFNQMSYGYLFHRETLPDHIIIPNQYGYGLTFTCIQQTDEEMFSMNIACTPYGGKTFGKSVHCFRSNNVRQTRSLEFERLPRQYINSRDGDTNNGMNYQMASLYFSTPPPGDMSTPEATSAPSPPPPPPPPPSQLPELRQILKVAKPFADSCIGAATGCTVCVLVLGRLPLGALPAICSGPCFVTTFGNCGALLGRVFAETTVICTELFKQAYLDIDTFIADAEYGRYILQTEPLTYKGYKMMATPIVNWMQTSTYITKIVSSIALPWSHHMKYIMGYTNEWSTFGWIIHCIGLNVCQFIGMMEDVQQQQNPMMRIFLIWFLLLLCLIWSRRCTKNKNV